MGLVRDVEFCGNSVIWSSSFSTRVCRYFGCSGSPWAHVLDFNLAQVRLFQTPGGGGGGGLFFFCMGRLAPSIYPPQPPGVFLHSYTRCPSESDKTGVMKIATKERDIDKMTSLFTLSLATLTRYFNRPCQ